MRFQVHCILLLDLLLFVRQQGDLQGVRDLPGDVALDRKDVLEGAIIVLGPQMRLARHVDQLRGDPGVFPALRTLPSRIVPTWRARPISAMSWFVPLYFMIEVRAITLSLRILES